MLTRMPWVKDKPPDEDEVEDVVTVSLSKTLPGGEVVTATRVTRTKARRKRIAAFGPVPITGKVAVRGDITVREALRVVKDFSPSLSVPLRGSVKLAGAIADR